MSAYIFEYNLEQALIEDSKKRNDFKEVINLLKPGVHFQYKISQDDKWKNSEFIKFTHSFTEPGTMAFFHRPEFWPKGIPIPKHRIREIYDIKINTTLTSSQ